MSHDDRRLPEGGVVVGKGKPQMMNLFTCKPDETGYTGSRFRSRLETHQRLLRVPLVNGPGREGPLSFALGLPVTVYQFLLTMGKPCKLSRLSLRREHTGRMSSYDRHTIRRGKSYHL